VGEIVTFRNGHRQYSYEDHSGERYGRLTVLKRIRVEGRQQYDWLCRCDCGNETVAQTGGLLRGSTRSCGCLAKDVGALRKTHGLTGSRTYISWRAMRARCLNPQDKDYPRYGGRDIKICERWGSFENFLADLGERPEGKSLDRIDCNGNYESGNVRWADDKTQSNNRRSSRYLTHDGKTLSIAEWAREAGIPTGTFWRRLKAGHSLEDSLRDKRRARVNS